jgi:hypothetical protein
MFLTPTESNRYLVTEAQSAYETAAAMGVFLIPRKAILMARQGPETPRTHSVVVPTLIR